jgi:hypothetical protein
MFCAYHPHFDVKKHIMMMSKNKQKNAKNKQNKNFKSVVKSHNHIVVKVSNT